jgi:hypothetical protein
MFSATGNTFSNSAYNIYNNNSKLGFNYYYLSSDLTHKPNNRYGKGDLTPSIYDCCTFHGYAEEEYYNHITPVTECISLWDEWNLIVLNSNYEMLELLYDAKEDEANNGVHITIDWEDPEVMDIIGQFEMSNDGITITIGGNPPTTDLEKYIVLYYELTNLKQQMDMLCYAALEVITSDTQGIDIVQYHTWAERFNTIESDYLLADIYISSGDFTQALIILNAMPSKFQGLDTISHQNFLDYLAVIQDIVDLDEGDDIPLYLITELERLSNNNDLAGIKSASFLETIGFNESSASKFERPISSSCFVAMGIAPNSEGEASENKEINNNKNQDAKQADDPLNISTTETKSEITVKPNPTTGQLVVSGQLSVVSVEIFDIVGCKLSHFTFHNSPIEIDISHLENGMYFLKIQTEKGITTKKIVKE